MTKAVVLAGGRGTRMKDLAAAHPKPMLPLAGNLILEHILDRLRTARFSSVLVVTGYCADAKEEYFATYLLDLHFDRQEPLNGTARAVLQQRQPLRVSAFSVS